MKNNKLKTFLLYLFTVVFFLPVVHAKIFPSILEDTLSSWFTGLPAEWVMKFILFWLVFAIVYGALTKNGPFKDSKQKGVPVTISLAVSAITVLAIPGSTLEAIFMLYGGILTLALFFIPFAYILFWLFKYKDSGPLAHLGILLAAGMMLSISYTPMITEVFPSGITSEFSLNDVFDLLRIVLIVVIFYSLYQTLRGFFKGNGDRSNLKTYNNNTPSGSGGNNLPITPEKKEIEAEDKISEDEKEIEKKEVENIELERQNELLNIDIKNGITGLVAGTQTLENAGHPGTPNFNKENFIKNITLRYNKLEDMKKAAETIEKKLPNMEINAKTQSKNLETMLSKINRSIVNNTSIMKKEKQLRQNILDNIKQSKETGDLSAEKEKELRTNLTKSDDRQKIADNITNVLIALKASIEKEIPETKDVDKVYKDLIMFFKNVKTNIDNLLKNIEDISKTKEEKHFENYEQNFTNLKEEIVKVVPLFKQETLELKKITQLNKQVKDEMRKLGQETSKLRKFSAN